MIVHQLVEHYEDLQKKDMAPPFGWETTKVWLGAVLNNEGVLVDMLPLSRMEKRGKREVEVGTDMHLPRRVIRTSGILPNFLADNAGYIFGYNGKKTTKRMVRQFDACKELHLEILEDVSGGFAQSIRQFFTNWQVEQAAEHAALQVVKDILPKGYNIVFMNDQGEYAHENEPIKKAWITYYNQTMGSEGLCLITGNVEPIVRIHGKIKGVYGAQTSGANIVSVNDNAFISYNLGAKNDDTKNEHKNSPEEKMPGAPVGAHAEFAYFTALNQLLANRESRMQLDDTSVVFWAEGANEKAVEVMQVSINPSPTVDDTLLEETFRRIEKGEPVQDVSLDSGFYTLGLAPNAARIAVKFFYQSTFGDMLYNIQKHYQRLEIIRPSFDEVVYLPPYRLLDELRSSKSREMKISPQIISGLMSSIVTGARMPHALYQTLLMRIRSEQANQKITRGKAALIKAYLLQTIQKDSEREVLRVSVNKESANRPYILGRLFSVLEQAQEDANPGIKATIRDRYFNAACATPILVFPQLLKLSMAHTSKGDYGKRYERMKQELLSRLDVADAPFPSRLSLEDQGLFILGYYHENQDRYTKKENKNEGN